MYPKYKLRVRMSRLGITSRALQQAVLGLCLALLCLVGSERSAFAAPRQADYALTCNSSTSALLNRAIQDANRTPEPDTITIGKDANGVPCTLVLASVAGDYGKGAVGLPLVTAPLTIKGNGATLERKDGAPAFRIFQASAPLTLVEMTLRNGYIENNNGGGIYASDSLVLTSVTMRDNQAFSERGGAVFQDNDSKSVTIRFSHFEGNHAQTAGAVDVYGRLNIIDSHFVENIGGNSLGALAARNDTIVTNSTFKGNIAGISTAGGAYFAGESVQLEGVTFTENYSAGRNTGAGGAYFNAAIRSLVITNSTFERNRADGFHGGAFHSEAAVTTLLNTTIRDNRADNGSGGGIYATGDLVVRDSRLVGNYAKNDGGAIYGAHRVTLINTQVNGNTAKVGRGGGLAQLGAATVDQAVSITDSSFEDNAADTGGSLAIGGPLTLRGTHIGTSSATLGGGMVAYNRVTIEESKISDNSARVGGGAYFYGNTFGVNPVISMTRVDFNGNIASSTDTGEGGGAIFAFSNPLLTIKESKIVDNVSKSSGGAIFSAGTSIQLEDSNFRYNVADGQGGAIYTPSKFSSVGSEFSDNKSRGSGGAISAGAAVELDRNILMSNSAGKDGAGLYLPPDAAPGATKVTNTLWIDNVATGEGGAIHIANAERTAAISLLHNTMVHSAPSAIYVGAGQVDVANSILVDQPVGIKQGGGTVTSRYNLFYDSAVDVTGNVAQLNDLQGDPLFASLEDFHLRDGSPAIDSGTDAGVTVDLDGNPRPQGNFDRGAYEQEQAEVAIAGLRATNDGPVTVGNAVRLTASVDAGTSVRYEWDFGDGHSGEGAQIAHTYAQSGSYVVRVTARNSVSSATAETTVQVDPAPEVDDPISGLVASNDGPQLVGEAVQFTAIVATGSRIEYEWDFGDGHSGEGAQLSHVYTEPGSYVVRVTARNSVSNATAETTAQIDAPPAEDEPIRTLRATNDGPVLVGSAIQLSATVESGTNVRYLWDYGDGTGGEGATVSHVYAAAGEYAARVTAQNGAGEATAETMVRVEPEAATDAPITGLIASNDSPKMVGETVAFSASVASGDNVLYTWDFGDGSSDIGATTTHSYSEPGNYRVLVMAINRTNEISATTSVEVPPTDTVDEPIQGLTAGNDGPTNLGNATRFTAQVATGTNVLYLWDFGDGGGALGAVVSHVYAAPGAYVARVTASNALGEAIAETSIQINDAPQTDEPITGLSVAYSGSAAVGAPIDFAAVVAGGSGVGYAWDFGDGATGEGAVITHSYQRPGVYTVRVTASNSMGSADATAEVVVSENPAPQPPGGSSEAHMVFLPTVAR